MNMMAPYGTEVVTEILVHAGFILTACAYLLRDILYLRGLAIAANVCVALAAWRAGMEPNWIVVAWAVTFILINLIHAIWLVYERHLAGLSEEEKRLHETAFQALDRVCTRRLLRRGKIVELADQACLVQQGVNLDRLLLISSGEAVVLVGGRMVSHLTTGKFVGEVAFLSGEPASATVVALGPVRCLIWERENLDELLERRPDLFNVFYAAVGKDLAQKVAAHNVSLSQL